MTQVPMTPADTAKATPERSKGGAPRNNRNAWRHGLRSARDPDRTNVQDDSDRFRRSLEDAVAARHGTISVIAAGLIQTATRSALAAAKVGVWIRRSNLTGEAEISARERELAFLATRDKAVAALGIDGAAAPDPWATFAAPAPGTPSNASAAKMADSPADAAEGRETPPEKRTDGITGSAAAADSIGHEHMSTSAVEVTDQ